MVSKRIRKMRSRIMTSLFYQHNTAIVLCLFVCFFLVREASHLNHPSAYTQWNVFRSFQYFINPLAILLAVTPWNVYWTSLSLCGFVLDHNSSPSTISPVDCFFFIFSLWFFCCCWMFTMVLHEKSLSLFHPFLSLFLHLCLLISFYPTFSFLFISYILSRK